MTLAALLTVFSITLAIFSIARPVGRRSLALCVPAWRMVAAICLSFICIIVRDAPFGVKPPFHWRLDLVEFGLSLGAFIAPVGIALWCWSTWYQAKLTNKNIDGLEGVIKAALREDEFDEVERIISKNKERLAQLPASGAAVLFNPKLVAALIESNSMVHLELMSNIQFLTSLDNRFGAVDVVVRELLRAASPLRSAVVKHYGGLENLEYTDAERELMEKTFLNPKWYLETRADYPLVISAIEELNSSKLDTEYNDVGRAYDTSQGMSRRSQCPVYLAVKTMVLAIETAIKERAEGDFYISDLHDIFHAVQEHSKFNTDIWDSDLANSEFPTPFAYLLYEIAYDFRGLSCAAVKSATSKAAQHQVEPPDRIAGDLARMWSYCVWSIADSEKQVGPNFRDDLIREYLKFILELGWAPSEVYYGLSGNGIKGLEVWRDLFAEELRQRFAGDSGKRLDALKNAMESLDQGKMYVFDGYDWLEQKLS
ncbi:MAG TPA: hypothetical protein VGK01_12750 [Candidatus Angelobacter sp.]|jgi:hypothetical protein